MLSPNVYPKVFMYNMLTSSTNLNHNLCLEILNLIGSNTNKILFCEALDPQGRFGVFKRLTIKPSTQIEKYQYILGFTSLLCPDFYYKHLKVKSFKRLLHVTCHPSKPYVAILFAGEKLCTDGCELQIINWTNDQVVHREYVPLTYLGHYKRFQFTESHLFLNHVMDPDCFIRTHYNDLGGIFNWQIEFDTNDGFFQTCIKSQDNNFPNKPYIAKISNSTFCQFGLLNVHYMEIQGTIHISHYNPNTNKTSHGTLWFRSPEAYFSQWNQFHFFIYYNPQFPQFVWIANPKSVVELHLRPCENGKLKIQKNKKEYIFPESEHIETKVCPVKEIVATKSKLFIRTLETCFPFDRF